MKFKHSFLVFVDNFKTTYKVLLYRVIVVALCMCIYTAIIFPFMQRISNTEPMTELSAASQYFGSAFANLDFEGMHDAWVQITGSLEGLMQLFSTRIGEIVGGLVVIVLVYFVQRFLLGIGNYTAGAMINDKMAMRADSPFIGTLIKNLGDASLYNAIYVPLSTIYDIIAIGLTGAAVYGMYVAGIPLLLLVFLFSTIIILLFTIKMTFTSDWLPALIYGKMNNRAAMKYSFGYSGKKFADVFSNFLVLVLIILSLNTAAVFLTFGAGLLITIPASYLILICMEFVNYCENNDVKYFLDKKNVVKPEKETVLTREQFFKGQDEL